MQPSQLVRLTAAASAAHGTGAAAPPAPPPAAPPQTPPGRSEHGGEQSASIATTKSGPQTAMNGLRRPQRVRTESVTLPTTRPDKRSTDLQIAMIMLIVAMSMPSASRYTVTRAGRTTKSIDENERHTGESPRASARAAAGARSPPRCAATRRAAARPRRRRGGGGWVVRLRCWWRSRAPRAAGGNARRRSSLRAACPRRPAVNTARDLRNSGGGA